MSLKLYDTPHNSNSRKIHAIAHEIGLTLQFVPMNLSAGEGQKPEYLKLNPNGKIPTLVDGNDSIWESNAIMIHLSTKYGKEIFQPQDSLLRAQMFQWLFWQTAHLQPAIGKIVMERFYKPKFNMGAPDPNALQTGLQEFSRFASVLNGALADRPYVVGSTPTLADFAIAGSFGYRKDAEIDLGSWEYLKRWLTSIEERPSWKKSL
jgi:glutathione S-transferase